MATKKILSPLVFLDRCAVCGKPATKKCGGCSLVFYCGHQHQKQDWMNHKLDCRPYEVKQVEGIGKCLMASRYIPAGTTIIAEYPIAIFDNPEETGKGLQKLLAISEVCLHPCPGCDTGKLTSLTYHPCSKCGIPLCSFTCEKSSAHSLKDCKALKDIGKKEKRPPTKIPEIWRDLITMRILQEEKKKGKPVSLRSRKWGPLLKLVLADKGKVVSPLLGTMSEKPTVYKQLLSSLKVPETFPLSMASVDKGSGEVIALLYWAVNQYSIVLSENQRKRALYEKYGFLSHSCAPNSEAWIDDKQFYYKLLVRVIKPIVPGERITINRGDPSLLCNPTLERRQKILKQFSLNCDCDRCIDPTEMGTYISGVRCTICKDSLACNYFFPTNPLDKRTSWTCTGKNCKVFKTYEQILVVQVKAEKELQSICGNGAMSGQPETTITKLQDFIAKHQRKILHQNHYLILIAKSRINKAVSYFLGAGEKLFLSVVTDMPKAYDYCSYKVEYLQAYLGFLEKLYSGENERTIGKIKYELGWAEAALVFQDFHQERLAGSSFFRRMHCVLETLNKCREILMPYSNCGDLVEDVKRFTIMLKQLFGTDFLSTNRLNKFLESTEEGMRKLVGDAIGNWSKRCEEGGFLKLYINPDVSDGSCSSNDKIVTRNDLQVILMDIPNSDG